MHKTNSNVADKGAYTAFTRLNKCPKSSTSQNPQNKSQKGFQFAWKEHYVLNLEDNVVAEAARYTLNNQLERMLNTPECREA